MHVPSKYVIQDLSRPQLLQRVELQGTGAVLEEMERVVGNEQ